ncbi:MAG TPA: hypothetical protein VF914_03295 [Chloroflexia bacterium]|jgi:hypothetical protein
MITYFLRRLAGGVATFLLASIVLYTAIVPLGASVILNRVNSVCMHCARQPSIYAYLGTYVTYKLDLPWPNNYFTWLYDPHGDLAQTFRLSGEPRQSGAVLPAQTVQFTSLGLLRGDFGQSMRVRPGTPALDMYGVDLLPWTTFIATLLLGSTAVAYLQRRNPPGSGKTQVATE